MPKRDRASPKLVRKATGLADPAVRAARLAALDAPHMAPLRLYAERLRASHGPTPDFDPADGGTGARVLLLLETPGPSVPATGFVSLDNPTGTSANLRRFLAEAGLDRGAIAIWNAVPWVIHTGGPNRAPRPAELRAGVALLPGLLPLFPALRAAVLAGRAAAMAEAAVAGLPVVRVPHPSPTYVCTDPAIPARIVAGLREAARLAC